MPCAALHSKQWLALGSPITCPLDTQKSACILCVSEHKRTNGLLSAKSTGFHGSRDSGRLSIGARSMDALSAARSRATRAASTALRTAGSSLCSWTRWHSGCSSDAAPASASRGNSRCGIRSRCWYDNWLNVEVSVNAGGFTGRFRASFQVAELSTFRDQLSSLYSTLTGEATFETLEAQLALVLTGDGRGGISLRGEAWDQPGVGNRLDFSFHLDQTHIAKTLGELNALVRGYPVRAGQQRVVDRRVRLAATPRAPRGKRKR